MKGDEHFIEMTTSKRLLSAAKEAFAQKGYDGTSVHEIAAAVGVSKPSLYHHFRSKENLYIESARETFSQLSRFLDELGPDAGGALEGLLQFCGRLHSLFCQRRELLYVFQGAPPHTPLFDLDDLRKRLWETLGGMVRGVSTTESRQDCVEEKTALVLGAIYMMSCAAARGWWTEKRYGTPRELRELVSTVFCSETSLSGV